MYSSRGKASSPQDSMPKARAAALRALELDDALSEAHAALVSCLSFYAWDQPASEKALRRAIALATPIPRPPIDWLGNIALLAMGRFDEAIAAGSTAGSSIHSHRSSARTPASVCSAPDASMTQSRSSSRPDAAIRTSTWPVTTSARPFTPKRCTRRRSPIPKVPRVGR